MHAAAFLSGKVQQWPGKGGCDGQHGQDVATGQGTHARLPVSKAALCLVRSGCRCVQNDVFRIDRTNCVAGQHKHFAARKIMPAGAHNGCDAARRVAAAQVAGQRPLLVAVDAQTFAGQQLAQCRRVALQAGV